MNRTDPRRSRRHGNARIVSLGGVPRPERRLTRTAASAALGSVIYVARLDGDLVKVGHTADLVGRVRALRWYTQAAQVELLAVLPGTADDEAELHRRLESHRARGREYYHPAPEVMAVVNDMRAQMGRPPC